MARTLWCFNAYTNDCLPSGSPGDANRRPGLLASGMAEADRIAEYNDVALFLRRLEKAVE